MGINTILALGHSLKGEQEVQSSDRLGGGYNLLYLWKYSEIQFQMPVQDVFYTGLGEKIILLFKDLATITCAGFLEAILMSIFNDQKLLLCHGLWS